MLKALDGWRAVRQASDARRATASKDANSLSRKGLHWTAICLLILEGDFRMLRCNPLSPRTAIGGDHAEGDIVSMKSRAGIVVYGLQPHLHEGYIAERQESDGQLLDILDQEVNPGSRQPGTPHQARDGRTKAGSVGEDGPLRP